MNNDHEVMSDIEEPSLYVNCESCDHWDYLSNVMDKVRIEWGLEDISEVVGKLRCSNCGQGKISVGDSQHIGPKIGLPCKSNFSRDPDCFYF